MWKTKQLLIPSEFHSIFLYPTIKWTTGRGATRSFFPGASAPHRDKYISTFQNAVGVTESAADGCLATTNASGAQPPERFGKKEKAARLAFSMRF